MTRLIVGLGNPGEQYFYSRHNIGFLVLDQLACFLSLNFQIKKKFEGALTEIGEWNHQKVILLKPLTFMNLSGLSIGKVLNHFKIPVENLLVVVDDLDLPFGKIRTRMKGSHGGHNGLKSIQQSIGTSDFKRVRVGIANLDLNEAREHKTESTVAHFVLSSFKPEEKETLFCGLQLALKAIEDLLFNQQLKTFSF